LYVAVYGGSIYRLNPTTGVLEDLVVTARNYRGVAYNSTDGMLYVTVYNGSIYRLNPKEFL